MSSLPLARNETVAADGVISSTLLNDIQDCIVGAKHGSIVKRIGAAEMNCSDASLFTPLDMAFELAASTGSQTVMADLGLPVGARVTLVKVICLCTAATAGAITAAWKKATHLVGAAVGAVVPVDVVAAVGSAATANVVLAVTLTPASPVVIGANEVHAVSMVLSNSAGNKLVFAVEVTYEKP